jgi:hypothetical protein
MAERMGSLAFTHATVTKSLTFPVFSNPLFCIQAISTQSGVSGLLRLGAIHWRVSATEALEQDLAPATTICERKDALRRRGNRRDDIHQPNTMCITLLRTHTG